MEALARLKVLLVEDHVDTAQSWSRLLSREGYAVTVAGNGADAKQKQRGRKSIASQNTRIKAHLMSLMQRGFARRPIGRWTRRRS